MGDLRALHPTDAMFPNRPHSRCSPKSARRLSRHWTLAERAADTRVVGVRPNAAATQLVVKFAAFERPMGGAPLVAR